MSSVVRAVCFDFDGTLAHFTGDFAALVAGLQGALGLGPREAEQLILARAQAERRGGPMRFADTVRAALTELGLPTPEDLEVLAAQVVGDYSAQMALLPGATGVLELCRAHGLPLALVTNGPADMQRAAVRAVGLEGYFERLVVSGDAEVGVRKPHPRIFARACEVLGAAPDETLMVGDNLEADVRGALSFGMRAVYLGAASGPGYDAVPDLRALGSSLKNAFHRSRRF